MKKNELVSIIVPIYNVEKYLSECVESIINQSYNNIEILLIDDGSTDNSGEIAKEYEKKDKRIKYYYKENGGLSSARNFGIDKSKGEYLMFIDSDDYIDFDMVKKLYTAITENNVDISCCGRYLEHDNETRVIYSKGDFFSDREDFFKRILNKNQIDTSCCDKMFKAYLFKEIRFPEGRLFEDLGTLYKIINICNGVWHIHYPLYHYRIRSGSITQSRFNLKALDSVYFRQEICSFVDKNYPTLHRDANKLYYHPLVECTFNCYKYNYMKEYKQLKKEVNKNILNIIYTVPFKAKIKTLLIYLNLAFLFKVKEEKKYEKKS